MAKHNRKKTIKIKHRHDLPKKIVFEGILISIIAFLLLFILYITILVPEASFESIAEEVGVINSDESGQSDESVIYTNDTETQEDLNTTEADETDLQSTEESEDDESDSTDEDIPETEDSEEDIMPLSEGEEDQQDLITYLEANGGSVRERVIRDGEFLTPDSDGGYAGIFGEDFTYSLTIIAPLGIPEGTYIYQIPEDITISEDDREEQEIYDDEDNYMGIRSIDDNGLLIIQISEDMNDKTDVTGFIECSASIIPKEEVEEPVEASIEKEGYFSPEDGKFHFTITAEIPAYDGVQYKAWYLYDQYEIYNNYNYENQDLSDAEISIEFNGTKKTLHQIDVAISNGDKIGYYYQNNKVYFVNICQCNSNNCIYKVSEEECSNDSIHLDWCSCWSLPYNATITVEYCNDDSDSLLMSASGQTYHNRALLTEMITEENIYGDAKVPIPTFISKSLTTKPTSSNNYTAKYKLVINQDKVDLSSKDSLTVEDVIVSGSYVPGSMTIVSTDTSGKTATLSAGTDYEVSYKETSDSGQRGFTLTIFNPGSCSYTVTYQAMIVGSSVGVEETVTVSNTATLLLYGSPSSSYSFNYGFTEGWSYKSLSVNILKKDSLYDDVYLSGAVFELYSSERKKLDEQTSDDSGTATFTTDIAHDVVLRTDTVYFLKEVSAPSGYQLDDSEYWFYANSTRDTTIENKYPGIHWIKVSTSRKTQGTITITNVAIPKLPETGMYFRDYFGIGIIFAGVLFSLWKLIIFLI